jgi:uncharacterized protein
MKYHSEMIKHYLIGILFALIGFNAFSANECFPVKSDLKMLYDEVGVLTGSENQEINQYLIQVSNQTSNQIVIVIVDDLCGMDKAMFATDLGQEWGVGRNEKNGKDGKNAKDNGIVILVKPTKTNGPRTTFIAVGYGLEGVIPDATAKMIVEKEMNPLFKQGKIGEGIVAGLNVIVPLVKQEFNYVAYNEQAAQKKPRIPYGIILLVLIVIIWKAVGARNYAQQNNMSFWSALMLGNLLSNGGGSGRRGGFGDFTSGGGGFGGFGGGGFGGGGSGGDW